MSSKARLWVLGLVVMAMSACGRGGAESDDAFAPDEALLVLTSASGSGGSADVQQALEALGANLQQGVYLHVGPRLIRHSGRADLGLVGRLELDSSVYLERIGFMADETTGKQRVTCVGTSASEVLRLPRNSVKGILFVARDRVWLTPSVPDLRSAKSPGVKCQPAEIAFSIGTEHRLAGVHYRHLADAENLPPTLLVQANALGTTTEVFFLELY